MTTYTVANLTDVLSNASWTYDDNNNLIGASGVGLVVGGSPTDGAVANSINITGSYLVNGTSVTSGLATLVSPTFSGTPLAPTAAQGTDTTQIATTAFVATSFAPLASPTFTGTLAAPTINATTALEVGGTNIDTIYATLNGPAFTGTPTAPTATAGTDTSQIATTAFVATSYAPLASPALTGTPTAPTASSSTDTTQIATTAYVQNNLSAYAPLASPTLTGTPAAPTAEAGTDTTQIATTAFVATSYAPKASPTFTGTASADNFDVTGLLDCSGGVELLTGNGLGVGTTPPASGDINVTGTYQLNGVSIITGRDDNYYSSLSPTSTTSTTGVMMGMGSEFTFTPKTSGSGFIVITGTLNQAANTGGYQAIATLYEGTGTAPSNGASPTGTQLSTVYFTSYGSENGGAPFCLTVPFIGATLGTTVWFDIKLSTSNSGCTAYLEACTGWALEI